MSVQYAFQYRQTPLREYERELGRMEIESLTGQRGRRSSDVIRVELPSRLDSRVLRRATFFERITETSGGKITQWTPDQVLLEKSTRAVRTGTLQQARDLLANVHLIPNAGREHTYLSHSWHQYKGKFYPQLVRSTFVIAGLSPGHTVLDPFVGSGTSLVEAYLCGLDAIGLDMNPLAVFLSNAKVDCLGMTPEEVAELVESLVQMLAEAALECGIDDELLGALDVGAKPGKGKHPIDLPNLGYLARWFDDIALQKLSLIWSIVQEFEHKLFGMLVKLTLSNILREYSDQDPKQLRVQRRKADDLPTVDSLLYRFVVDLRRNSRSIIAMAALRDSLTITRASQKAVWADARDFGSANLKPVLKDGSVDHIVTSPPYATALPYLDTDRLSLYLLNLLSPDERWPLEYAMIGNREIRRHQRVLLESQLDAATTQNLPIKLTRLIGRIRERNEQAGAGFRRQNLPALLFKYFTDMDQTFQECGRVLKTGGQCVIIVGNNRTTAGGQIIDIPTDEFLVSLAERNGLVSETVLDMTDQAAYLPHSQNAIRSESILFFRRR